MAKSTDILAQMRLINSDSINDKILEKFVYNMYVFQDLSTVSSLGSN